MGKQDSRELSESSSGRIHFPILSEQQCLHELVVSACRYEGCVRSLQSSQHALASMGCACHPRKQLHSASSWLNWSYWSPGLKLFCVTSPGKILLQRLILLVQICLLLYCLHRAHIVFIHSSLIYNFFSVKSKPLHILLYKPVIKFNVELLLLTTNKMKKCLIRKRWNQLQFLKVCKTHRCSW